jgi:hypothetical protein
MNKIKIRSNSRCKHEWEALTVDPSWIFLECMKCFHTSQVEYSKEAFIEYAVLPIINKNNSFPKNWEAYLQKFIAKNQTLIHKIATKKIRPKFKIIEHDKLMWLNSFDPFFESDNYI